LTCYLAIFKRKPENGLCLIDTTTTSV